MFDLPLDPTRPRRVLIAGAPEGHDARILGEIARTRAFADDPGPLVHIALDDARMARLQELLAVFAPEVQVLEFPAWDCLPYDRVSPHADIVSRRVLALSALADGWAGRPGPRIVLATVNAALQRVPPRDLFQQATFTAAPGGRIDLEALQGFLARNGYTRTGTVREAGEFAIRGDIIDLFPPGAEEPLRMDLFGDELEKVRAFDPVSQRTIGERDGIALRPMAEFFLDSDSIARFRSGYRDAFGAVTGTDPLYEAVTEGRRHTGMEHWLPLFHARMETLFDYVGPAAVTIDHQGDHARENRLTQVRDFFDARQSFLEIEKKAKTTVPYKPLPPERLYLTAREWETLLAATAVADLSPFTGSTAAAEHGDSVIDAQGRRGRDFAEERTNPDVNVYEALRTHATELRAGGRRVVIAGYTTGARDRMKTVLGEHGMWEVELCATLAETEGLKAGRVAAMVLPLEHGFLAPDLAVVTEQDILGDRLTRPARKRRKSDQFIAEVSSLSEGDLVVHMEHGIARYEGLETLAVGGAPHDCLKLVYQGGDKLFLPVENIEVLSRFGSEATEAQLDKLGGAGWQARKAKVKKRLKDMADALMRIAAARHVREAEPVHPPDGTYEEFVARFPFPETDDQLKAIEDVLEDLGSGRPMDRLVCGDVGFGKTEVALRAAFTMAINGGQVAVVAPTTLLVRQHYKTFQERFQGLPVRVGMLSRLTQAKETRETKKGLEEGTVEIVVGTHALLSKTVKFKNLGMVIVDEEQRFGVKQKERLKELRADVHVLTLTATPIPRTLQMSLAGVRELSLIATPPVDRLAVRTFVLPFDPMVVREAILREHFRGGQTYYVCPRIEDLEEVRKQIVELVPEVKIVAAHGQMAGTQLEEVMTAFYEGQFDVLLSTTIVESGLDVPSANTMILHRADMFGLAQLYQLRGRIGRSKLRGYAYLTYDRTRPLTKTAEQRLHVIETLDTLGAGFTLASHDMDIRGAGNLLGEEQSGHVKEVGVELYQQMLEEAVAAARSGAPAVPEGEEPEDHDWVPTINLGMPVLIPESYVNDLNVRLDLYRRVSRLADRQEIDQFAAELIDRFGPLPDEVENLLSLVTIKRFCKEAGVERLDAGPKGAVVQFRNNSFRAPDKLLDFVARQKSSLKLRPDHRLVYVRGWETQQMRVDGSRKLVKKLAEIAA